MDCFIYSGLLIVTINGEYLAAIGIFISDADSITRGAWPSSQSIDILDSLNQPSSSSTIMVNCKRAAGSTAPGCGVIIIAGSVTGVAVGLGVGNGVGETMGPPQ